MSAPLTDMLKGGKAGKFTAPFLLTEGAQEAFYRLRDTFTTAPMLAHFDPEQPIRLETDASQVGVAAILSQQNAGNEQQKHWQPVAYFSRKLSPEELNYPIGDQEMLAIVAAFKQ